MGIVGINEFGGLENCIFLRFEFLSCFLSYLYIDLELFSVFMI